MKPVSVIAIHQSLCAECADRAADPCAACEHGHWGRYISGCPPPPPREETSEEREETAEERYARAFPEQYRGISGCCDRADSA